MKSNKKELPIDQWEELFNTLKARFEKNKSRHKDIEWTSVLAKLEANIEKLWSLSEMERTGGEPDVVGYDKTWTNIFLWIAQPKVQTAAEVFVTTIKR